MARDIFADLFDDTTSWIVFASGQSEGKLHLDKGPHGKKALRMDYDFHGGKGFVVARKEIQFVLPDTFEFQFFLRGKGLANHLEFKVIDPNGADAWRFLREDYPLPPEWHAGRIRERDLPFAWGPEGGGPPKVVGAIELVIAAGPGGRGSVWFADLGLEDQTMYLPKSVHATSSLPSNPPESVFRPGSPSGWQAEKGDAKPCWWVDFGRQVRFGGLVISWLEPKQSRVFEIEISNDGEWWECVYQAKKAIGGHTHVPTRKAEARYLRIRFGNSKSATLRSLELRPDAFSHTPSDFIHAVARDYPRGWFPRYWHHEQSYWTPVGSPEGRRRALINEEGMVEVDEAGFSLEPFLMIGDKLVTWAEAETRVSLPADGSPLPTVTWKDEGVSLEIQPWVDGAGDGLVLRVTYRLVNESGRRVKFAVAVRPFQVNPPWQAFRNLGGVSPISEIHCEPGVIRVGNRQVMASQTADEYGVASFEETSGIVSYLARGVMPSRDSIRPPAATSCEGRTSGVSNLASAAMAWKLARETSGFEVTLSVPFFDRPADLKRGGHQRVARKWEQVVGMVHWTVPAAASEAVRCFRTAAGHILINGDGPAIQPGPRRYTRSWVRDCVIMGSAMAKAGHPKVLRKFLLWYVKFQRDDGYVPSVVDRDGVDPLVEHDSHGQLLWGICEVYRQQGDRDFLDRMWPHVKLAADFLQNLRQQHLPFEFSEAQCASCHGLLPESASHEGYLAHPVHSFWDDFWGIRGMEAAVELAGAAGFPKDAARWQSEAADFRGDVIHSIETVIGSRKIDYIPGSVEWADFDPTATANAISQLDFADDLPEGPVHRMLDTYLEGFRAKHQGRVPWHNYTAYEIRIIGAFVRLGRRKEAFELLEFFLSDRRPIPWNQWPEISWRDPRSPGHLGDTPHTWIAAEYMLALASMVASEREATESVVLAAGLPWEWIANENGFAVKGLEIRWGSLDLHLRATEIHSVRFEVREGIRMPSGGITLAPPIPEGQEITHAKSKDGRRLELSMDRKSVVLDALPIAGTLFFGPLPRSADSI